MARVRPFLPKTSDLAGIAVRAQVSPEQPAGFRNPHAGEIEEAQQHPVARFRFGGEYPLDILLTEDAFR